MLYVYLFALVFGGVLLGASIFFGDAHDGDGDLSHSIEADHGTLDGLISIFASLRFWTFFCFFFGSMGAVMTQLDWAATTVTLLSSVVIGAVTGFAAAKIFKWVNRSQSNSVANLGALVGQNAEVIVSVSKDKIGKVRVRSETGMRDLLATTVATGTLKVGESAQILSVVDGTAHIARPKLGLDEELELRARDQK